MRYINVEYLINDYMADMEAEEKYFPMLIARAERDIETLTSHQLTEELFSKMNDTNREHIKKAISAQAEYLGRIKAKYGTIDFNSIPDSFSIGSYSETNYKTSGASGKGLELYATSVYNYLFPTGLLFKGVGYI